MLARSAVARAWAWRRTWSRGPPESRRLWGSLQALLVNERERRLVFQFYGCGLKSREVVMGCPQEFAHVKEIYRLNQNIIERLRRSRERLRYLLGSDE